MQHSTKANKISTKKRNNLDNVRDAELGEKLHRRRGKYNKPQRGQGGYKGAFFNIKEHEINVMLGA